MLHRAGSGKRQLTFLKRILDAAFEEHAPRLRVRERLLETWCRQHDAQLAITNEDEQIFRACVRGQSLRGCAAVLRLRQRSDERKELAPRR